MTKNPLAHLKHRDPEAWRTLSPSEKWCYDMGWTDATALLIQKELGATVVDDGT